MSIQKKEIEEQIEIQGKKLKLIYEILSTKKLLQEEIEKYLSELKKIDLVHASLHLALLRFNHERCLDTKTQSNIDPHKANQPKHT